MSVKARHTARSYSEQSTKYEKKWGQYLNHTHTKLIERLDIQNLSTLCDLSCGTGLFGREVITLRPDLEFLLLNDLSSSMVHLARQQLPANEHIQYSSYPASQIGKCERSFKQMVSLNAFHHYVNQQEVLSAVYKTLEPGGTFYILDWNNSGLFKIINWFIKLFVKEHTDTRSFDELKKMLGQEGFVQVNGEQWWWRYWHFYIIEAQKPKA